MSYIVIASDCSVPLLNFVKTVEVDRMFETLYDYHLFLAQALETKCNVKANLVGSSDKPRWNYIEFQDESQYVEFMLKWSS